MKVSTGWWFSHMRFILVIYRHLIVLCNNKWESEINLVRSFQHCVCKFLVKLSLLVTIASITQLIFMRLLKHIQPFTVPKLSPVGRVGGGPEEGQTGTVRAGLSLWVLSLHPRIFFQIMTLCLCLMGNPVYPVIIVIFIMHFCNHFW